LEDYADACAALARSGFNELVVWGLYISRSWPLDIEGAVPDRRGRLVERLIATARAHKLRVLSGLGVYSWGFDEIIRANRHLGPTNANALCLSHPGSWPWMQRIIDFVFTRFDIDGVSMQSADQGRCSCERCRKLPDAEYHARINILAADYIRSRWSDKIVGVSSWGMDFSDPRNTEAIGAMSKSLDYLIDFNNSSARQGLEQRRRFIRGLACDFGTLGGPQPEPPQHWPRDRWFLPTLKRTGEHLRQLAADGGRACEYFFHIRANPGDAVSQTLAGRVLRDPTAPWEQHAVAAVDEVFGVSQPAHREQILALLLDAEDAYFRHLGDYCGTVSLEPLVADKPGPPVYLTQRLNKAQMAAYAAAVPALVRRAEQLAVDLPGNARIAETVQCLRTVEREVLSLSIGTPG
nr:hypothetical protein [Pirellulaceae bacterium]